MPSAKKTLVNQMDNAKHIMLLLVIVFHLFVYNYVLNLERTRCDCSDNWQREFIKYYSLVALVISTSLFITGFSGSNVRLPIAFSLLFSLFGLINAFVIFFYTKNLMDAGSACECSGGRVRTAIHYLSAFRVILTLFALLSAIFFLVFLRAFV